MSGELGGGFDGVVAEEEAARNREPSVADLIRVAEEAGEALPVREFELAFGAIDDGFAESYGEADGGAEDLIVVGKVVHITAEIIGVEAELTEKLLLAPSSK